MSLAADALYDWFMEVEFFPRYFKVFLVSDMVNLCSGSEDDAVYRVFGVSGNFGAMHRIQTLAFKIFADLEFRITEKTFGDYCQIFSVLIVIFLLGARI